MGIRQEIINVFQELCNDLETINPNHYKEISFSNHVDPRTGKAVKISYLREKSLSHKERE